MKTQTSVKNQLTSTAREHYTNDSVTSKDGTTISYRQLGHGPGVVLLHGAMESAHSHMQLAEALADAFTVYLPERRGHNLSSPDRKDYSIQMEVEDIDALLTKTGAHNSVGAERAIRQVESPFPEGSNVLLVESLVGQEFDCLQGEGDVRTLLISDASPVDGSYIAQDVLEPVLRARAEQLGGDLRFGTELVSFEQDEEGITATIRERAGGNTRAVRAQFLVAADGSHSGIRQQLGIGQHGTASMGHFMSMIIY